MTALRDQIFNIPEHNSTADYTISGQGSKQLVIVVESENYGKEEAELLGKMIKAIQYDQISDVYLLAVEKGAQLSLSAIVESWNDIILFGVSPHQIGIHIEFKPYLILPLEAKRALYVDDLKSLGTNAAKKQALWTLFQKMFLKG